MAASLWEKVGLEKVSHPMESPVTNTSTEKALRQRRLVGILLIGFVCLLVGFVLRAALYQGAFWSEPAEDLIQRTKPNAPFIKTPNNIVDKMVQLANINKDDLVYDLGCGDGRYVITAAMQTACHGVGYEIEPEIVVVARQNVMAHGVEDLVRIEEQDVFKVDLRDADVILVYLLKWMLEDLIPQFDAMKAGSRIVSHDFWIEGVEPDEVLELEDDQQEMRSIFLYTLPLTKNPAMERGKPPKPRSVDKEANKISP